MSSGNAYSMSMPVSPPPPVDLPTYSRSMYQHTKRLMEAGSSSSHRRAPRTNHSAVPGMPNGASSSSSSASPNADYHG